MIGREAYLSAEVLGDKSPLAQSLGYNLGAFTLRYRYITDMGAKFGISDSEVRKRERKLRRQRLFKTRAKARKQHRKMTQADAERLAEAVAAIRAKKFWRNHGW
jgi:hypothetical protein